jgi:NADP-dependent 3-hydroxy acid dehydrogenase YdfG
MRRVEGKVAIVTGSTYGIGEAIAKILAREGAVSIITGRSQEEGKKVVEEITNAGGKAEYYPLDVTDEKRIEEVVKAVWEKYGKIDILVNNAGVAGPNKPTHEYARVEWEWVFDVNVTGAFLCTKYVVPYMQKQKSGISSTSPPSTASLALLIFLPIMPPRPPTGSWPRSMPCFTPKTTSASTPFILDSSGRPWWRTSSTISA